jgi:CRISPR/Cas system-associated exonuclease Cas4 (RecB family)
MPLPFGRTGGDTLDFILYPQVFEQPKPATRFTPKPTRTPSEIPAILSPTSLNTFMDCSAKWYYRKVLQLPETRGAALGLGTAVHEALGENFRQKIETKEDLPTEGVTALFVDAMTRQLDQITLEKDESADELKQLGETLVRVYMDQAAPRIEPAAVEMPVEGFIGDVPVHGFIDILTTDGDIIDIKTASKKPAGISADHRLQLSTYAMLAPQASGKVRRDALAKTKTVTLTQASMEVTPADRKLTTRLYSIARDHMRAGLIIPNRGSFLCSRKYCSFCDVCSADFGGAVE